MLSLPLLLPFFLGAAALSDRGLAGCVNETLFCYHTGEHMNTTVLDEAIEKVCAQHKDYEIATATANVSLDAFTSSTGVQDVVMRFEVMGRANPHCSYVLSELDCVAQFRKPASQCPTEQGGYVVHDIYGMKWMIASASQLTSTGILPDGVARNISSCEDLSLVDQTSPGSHAKRTESDISGLLDVKYEDASDWSAQQCYNSGQKWDRTDLLRGSNAFCYWAQGKTVLPGDYLNYTWHYCVDGVDRKQWFTIQTQEGARTQDIEYAQCMDGLLPFIDGCNTEGDVVKQGGWGMNSGGYMILDPDPNLHNPGKSERDLVCSNGKAAK